MRIIFAGTPEIAALCLDQLCLHHDVVGVLTQPDRPCGRGKKLESSAVKLRALREGIPVRSPEKIDAETLDFIKQAAPDLMIVVAYGLILPQVLLAIPRLGCWNVHYSLLPRWRGAAPVQRAIEAGDTETGVAIMQMAKGLDTGDILWEQMEPIRPDDTSETLSDRLAIVGANALIHAIHLQLQGTLLPRPQLHQHKTYAHKLLKTEGWVNWAFSAEKIERQIRAFQPWPVSYSYLDGQVVRIWKASVFPETVVAVPGTILAVSPQGIDIATGSGILRLLSCQLPGKKTLPVKDLLNAQNHPWKIGKRFESIEHLIQ